MYQLDEPWKDDAEASREGRIEEVSRTGRFTQTEGRWAVLGAAGGVAAGGTRLLWG